MTRIGVKLRQISNLYVLIVFAPGSFSTVLTRRSSRRPWAPLRAGDALHEGRRVVRVSKIRTRVERCGDTTQHVTEVFTRGRRAAPPNNVVRMPSATGCVVAQFIRFHVLVRVYGGDPDAWLAATESPRDDGDIRFLRLMRTRLRHDPALLSGIREMVDTTRFWSVG